MADAWGPWEYAEAVFNPIGSTARIASDVYGDIADARERELEVSAKEREARAKQKEHQRKAGKSSAKGSKSSSSSSNASASTSGSESYTVPSLDLVSDGGTDTSTVLAGVDAGTAAKAGAALFLVVVGVAVLARR